MAIRSKTSILLIQPTSLCNLNCRYCYVPDRKVPGLISDEILETIFSKALQSPLIDDYLVVNWHAGEPLTAGIPFYRKAFEMCDRYNTRPIAIKHVIQTNALLVNDEWCDFFLSVPNVEVRVSIDGPEFLHDLSRKTWKGTGTHRYTLAGLKRLQQSGMGGKIICVLAAESLKYPREIFDFFAEVGVESVAFNLEEIEGENRESSILSQSQIANQSLLFAEQYRTFFETFLSLYRENRPGFRVREFDSIKKNVVRLQRGEGDIATCPETLDYCIVTILKNGDVSTYGPELASGTEQNPKQFVIGNIMDVDSFEDLFHSEAFYSLQADVHEGRRLCMEKCQFFEFCGGGNPANKFYELGKISETETEYCRLHRQLLSEVVLSAMEVVR